MVKNKKKKRSKDEKSEDEGLLNTFSSISK